MNLPSLWQVLARAWDRYWFAPGSALNLAVARIVFASSSLWVLASRNFSGVSALPADFWGAVPTSLTWRFLDFGGHPSRELVLEWIAGAALVSAIIGILPRLSCFCAGILLYHLAPLESIIWTNSPYARGLTISVLALLTLSFSRCGDRCILFPLHRSMAADPDADSWAIRLIQGFIAQIYFFSGYSKVVYAGWKWASASNLRNWLLYFNEAPQTLVFHSLGLWIAARPTLCGIIGAATLALELAFPLVLFSKAARRVLVPLVAIFHLGILLSMNLVFLNVPQLLVFADWNWLKGRWGGIRLVETHVELPGPLYEAEPSPHQSLRSRIG